MMRESKFAERLREVRAAKGISQRDVALALGISDVSYGAWERGQAEPSIGKLEKLCGMFGVSADSLLGLEPFRKPVGAIELKAKSKKAKSALEELFALIDRLPE